MDISSAINEVTLELSKAMSKHDKMITPHEGWAVIYEEAVKELGDLVFAWRGSAWRGLSKDDRIAMDESARLAMRKEAMQVAAMGLRFMIDLT